MLNYINYINFVALMLYLEIVITGECITMHQDRSASHQDRSILHRVRYMSQHLWSGSHFRCSFLLHLNSYYLLIIMSPALLCKSNVQLGNAEQCACTHSSFCHPVAPVTLYHFIPIYVPFVNA